MTRPLTRLFDAPAAVLAFGVGGLIQFVGFTALVLWAPQWGYAYWLACLAQYGAIIVSFVGALQSGYAVRQTASGRDAWIRYGWSVAPALAGWLSLQTPVWTALRVQAAALILTLGVDRAFAENESTPSWLLTVRSVLTIVGST